MNVRFFVPRVKRVSASRNFACTSTSIRNGPEARHRHINELDAGEPECDDYTWTGFYFGGNAGYGWGSADTHFDPLPDAATFEALAPQTLDPYPNGFIGGGQVGYNWQWNKWLVLGVETDFQGSDIEGSHRRSPFLDNFGGISFEDPDVFLEAHERMQWFGNSSRENWFCPTVPAPDLRNGRSRLRQCGLFGADQLRQRNNLFNQVQRNERRLDRWRWTRVRDQSSLERESRVPVL